MSSSMRWDVIGEGSAGRIILHPEWIIDGTGASPLTDAAVVISGAVIEAVGPVASIMAQPSDRVIDLPRMTLIPGLLNCHVHLVLPGDNTPFLPWIDLQSDATLALQAVHNGEASLRAGVTTVRDCGGRGTTVIDVRNAQASGLITGPRVLSCGWPLTITGGHTHPFGGEVDGEQDVRRMVRDLVSKGVDYIKVMASGGGTPGSLQQYPSFSVAELRAIVEEAHALGRRVAAHCIASASISHAIDAQVDVIEHASFVGPDLMPHFDHRIAEWLAAANIPVVPTLQVNRELMDCLPDGPERSQWQRRLETRREMVAELHRLGVRLLAGADSGWRATAFNTFWKELDELVECGLSPVAAIGAATGAASQALGYGDQFGTIRAGQAADVVVVEGNLAADIRQLACMHAVFQAGALVSSRLPVSA